MVNAGGSPCRFRYRCAWISRRCSCVAWRGRRRMGRRPGGYWLWRRFMTVQAERGGQDRRRRASDRARLGGAVQRPRSGRPARRQGARQPSRLNDAQRRAWAMIENGPIPAVHGVVRWRLVDLAQWICDEFRVTSPSRRQPGAERMGYASSRRGRATMPRPRVPSRHFKKASPRAWKQSRPRKGSPATR